MQLTTPRLTIAPLAASDVDAFTAYRQDPAIARYQGWSLAWSADDSRRLVAEQAGWSLPPEGDWLQLGLHARVEAIDAPADAVAALVGDVAVHLLDDQPDTWEVGVTLAPASQGCGFAREALVAVVDALVLEHGAHRVIASSDARNDAVARLLSGLGMRHEGRQVEADFFRDEWTSIDLWAVLASEWREHRAQQEQRG